MMGDLKPTESGESKGWNFDATRDNAWRIDRSSGRVHYVSKTFIEAGQVLFHSGFSQDLFQGREDGLIDSRCLPTCNWYSA